MYRLRFETIEQVFIKKDCEIILPLSVLYEGIKSENASIKALLEEKIKLYVEIPAIIWENSLDFTKEQLNVIFDFGIKDAVCENIGALALCQEIGYHIHGGMFLNVINLKALSEYKLLKAESMTLSFEMPFNKMRSLSLANPLDMPLGMLVYGYIPLMKFRACPAMNSHLCKDCKKDNYLVDRKNERFRILCRDSKYSELLNCVPLYVADKSLPKLDFYTLYFTVESKKECMDIFDMVLNKDVPQFRRTAGLYNRELL